jgi:ATP-dependent DNA helicase RecG
VTVDLDQRLRGVLGPKAAEKFSEVLGIETVGDLLRHYPRRYLERGELTSFAELMIGEQATVSGRVKSVRLRSLVTKKDIPLKDWPKHRRSKTLTRVVITDGRRDLDVPFFNQAWLAGKLTVGTSALFWGEVALFNRTLQLKNAGSEVLDEPDLTPDEIAAKARPYRPLYPASSKLDTKKIENSLTLVLDGLDLDPADDPIPPQVRRTRGLVDLGEALEKIHRPNSPADWDTARERLRFEEALLLQTVLAQRRAVTDALPAVPRERRPEGLLAAFDRRLPFELTAGQAETGEEIFADLARAHPMHRLLQGEVGSGKTLVALRAMLAVVDAGGQAALLAPTEVLAVQHHRTLQAMLGPLAEAGMLGGAEQATRIALLTGSLGAQARRTALLQAASGEAGIVVGTHALLEEKVQFADLGLVVVDEQHRFGVEQRAALSQKSGAETPHVLVMTATPIPRTVAMTVFGDLAVSTLTELPKGRSPISSSVVPAEKQGWLDRAWQRVREEVAKGHQVYVVCPRIGDEPAAQDDERRPAVSVLETAEVLSANELKGLRLEVLHGRLAPDVKDGVMSRFAAGEVDVLVATTVVEVGVDVPNSTVMVVLDADRFGISQLHQLRGRIGRGSAPGLCLLVTDAPPDTPARDRLEAVAATTDGFELSRVDLEQRREGDVLGAAQSGRRSSLKLLGVLRDEDVIADARAVATELVAADPGLTQHEALRRLTARLAETDQADYLDKT